MMLPFDEFVRQLASALDVREPSYNRSDSLFDTWLLDSLKAFQMIIVVEALAGCDVPPDTIPEIYTVGDAYDYYGSLR